MRDYKAKFCLKCDRGFIPMSSTQKYCKECKQIAYKERSKQYRLEHSKQRKEWQHQYRLEHSKEIKQYCLEHSKDKKQYDKQYRQTERGKEISKKFNHKRQRNLGFISLNKSFEGSVAHHLDNEKVLNIPKELHQSINHNQYTGQGMKEMNTLAVQYWISQVMKQGHKCFSI